MNPRPCVGLLVLVCTETGREVPTGVEYTQAELATTKSVTIYEQCPFCDRSHVFGFAEARVITKPCLPLDAHEGPNGTPAKTKQARRRREPANE
jgi:hypothetical protein